MKRVLLFILSASLLSAANGKYTAVKKTVLAGAVEAVTVQVPVGSNRMVAFDSASVYCSAQCEITIERDGTLATTTALTVAKLRSTDATNGATAFYSSNAGTGTTIGTTVIPAGETAVFDLRDVGLKAGESLTIKTDSITATVVINVKWGE